MNFCYSTLAFISRLARVIEQAVADTDLAEAAISKAMDLHPYDSSLLDNTWSRAFLISHIYMLMAAEAGWVWLATQANSEPTGEAATAATSLQRDTETITVEQAAELLQISTSTVRTLCAQGHLVLVADDYVTNDSVLAFAEEDAKPGLPTKSSTFNAKPPSNGSPNTAGAGGSR